LKTIATAGFAPAFHVRFTTPTFLFQTYPKDWLDYYSQNGLVMSDPTVMWGFENTGAVDWAALQANDSAGVLAKAAEYGLKHGATYATEIDGSHSIGTFARTQTVFPTPKSHIWVRLWKICTSPPPTLIRFHLKQARLCA
jgi:LuxR family transcriptional regulator